VFKRVNGTNSWPSGQSYGRWALFYFLLLPLIGLTSGCEQGQAEGIRDYEEARSIFWRDLYAEGGETLYCGVGFGSGYNDGLNVEHVFPMSWVTGALGCGTRKQCRNRSELFNRIEADLHNLYPSRQDVNAERSSYRFAELAGEDSRFRDCDFEVDYDNRRVEPRATSRGDIARSMFYMENRYRDAGLEIFNAQARMLREWHRNDPPGAKERERNDRIESLQGNRNPYIDSPDLL
jgi:deoxyribonuclease-1